MISEVNELALASGLRSVSDRWNARYEFDESKHAE